MHNDRNLPDEFNSPKIKRIERQLRRTFKKFEHIHLADEWTEKELYQLFTAMRSAAILWSEEKESFRKKYFEESVASVTRPYLDIDSAIDNAIIFTRLLDELQPLCAATPHSSLTMFAKFIRIGYLFRETDHDFVEYRAQSEYTTNYIKSNKINASKAGVSRTSWRRYALMEGNSLLREPGEWNGMSLARQIIIPVSARLGRNATPPSLNSLSRFLLKQYPDRLKSKQNRYSTNDNQ